ncbi:hypothetical protein PAHAL_7G347800 [Panicum hallii]|uniref:Peroxidase n=1 Tax=Panicum hallii TaxID=206008 RepID=A0A2T8IEI6_9POAL|nr:cationic peroxidase SPC4-like [Panicum hallii]PVH36067.1 hypothetical protein PAHAL_7G347800 [Panicum hallii]
MATSTTRVVRGSGVLVAIMAMAMAVATATMMTNDDTAAAWSLAVDFHALSCPDLHGMVHSAVAAARGQDVQVTAGLLRIFFHDCFPQGCDASILLDGWNSEKKMIQNEGLQQRALDLIESIRDTVHKRCGATVSCADILALATGYAVTLAGGPWISMPLGRRDSLEPAPFWAVNNSLPRPDADVNTLIDRFRSKGLGDHADLVALSGAHTVGKARCKNFRDRISRPNDDFTWRLAGFCGNDGNRQQNLDVITPDTFDNRYFVDLRNRQGVLTTDQGIANDGRTSWLIKGFADNQAWFFGQFAQSMVKLSQMRGAGGGEIRGNCFRRNAGGINLHQTQTDAAAAGDDEATTLAASA